MSITHLESSEVVTGLVIKGKISPNVVRADLLFSPYDEVVKAIKNGTAAPEDLILKFGLGTINPCLEAVNSLNGLSNADWISILEETYMKSQMGIRMEKLGKKLQRGDEVDPVEIRHIANQFGKGKTGRFSLSESLSEEVPFMKTGFLPIDKHLGGFPEAGLIVVGGDTGVGKTTFLRDVSKQFVKQYQNKTVAIYSLEMFAEEITGRFRESGKEPEDEEKRIIINCDPLTINQVIADAAGIDNLGMVLIDYVDMMVKGEATTGKYSEIYVESHYAAKQLHVPVILFAQFTYKYTGGIPKMHHIAWTNSSNTLAWEQLMLYRPAESTREWKDANILPIIPGIGYIIAWKIRGGCKAHKDEFPGAIQLPFDGVKGWGVLENGKRTSGKWFTLVNTGY